MSGHGFARSYRDLIVYQKARAAAKAVFQLTKAFPREEMYSLTDQVRRSSRSIGGQISEAWAKRRYPNHFASKLTDADGEQNETQHWLETAQDCQYVDSSQTASLRSEFDEIGRMLQRMIDRADEFRGKAYGRVEEEKAPYGAIDEFFAHLIEPTEH